eukprot:m.220963 g.220963  ORF g.220963 m.220963 type:complete len:137 (+) comp17243_c0_seq76:2904-3314(+)
MAASRSFKPPTLAKRSKSSTTQKSTSQATSLHHKQRPASILFKSAKNSPSQDQFAQFKEAKQLRQVLYTPRSQLSARVGRKKPASTTMSRKAQASSQGNTSFAKAKAGSSSVKPPTTGADATLTQLLQAAVAVVSD